MGEYEPNDSRTVTGTATGSGGRWSPETGIEPERTGVRESESRNANSRATDANTSATDGASAPVSAKVGASGSAGHAGQVREHMRIIGADGAAVGTVDRVEGNRIKLTKDSSSAGFDQQNHAGHHHYIPTDLIADVEGDTVRLSATGANAVRMEEEKNG